MSELKIFKDMEANCANCPFGITEGDIKKCYNDCGDKPNECYECNYLEYYLKSEADKVIAHQKYKRCLAMAKACHEKSERMYCEASVLKAQNESIGKEPKDAVVEKFELWGAIASTHRKIWLALAAEPTWAKFLQLIHKEEK